MSGARTRGRKTRGRRTRGRTAWWLLGAAAALAAGGLATRLAITGIVDDGPVLQAGSGLEALGAVLAGPEEGSDEIDELLACLPLWKMQVRRAGAGAGAPQDERFTVALDFAEPARLSARTYRLVSTVTLSGQGKTRTAAVGPLERRLASSSLDNAVPSVTSPAARRVLAATLADAALEGELAAWLAEPGGPLVQLTLAPAEVSSPSDQASQGQGDGTTPSFLYRLGAHRGGFAGAEGTESRYWVVSAPGPGTIEVVDREPAR